MSHILLHVWLITPDIAPVNWAMALVGTLVMIATLLIIYLYDYK